MRILFDHNVPVPLLFHLSEHQVETAYEKGWAQLTNGVLLQTAEDAGFDLLITTDKGIRFQRYNLRSFCHDALGVGQSSPSPGGRRAFPAACAI